MAHAAEQDRADVAAARITWRKQQPELNPERPVFIDEPGATTKMARLYGRTPRGQRLVMSVPYGHWKTATFVAGLRHDRIDAPCVIDGPIEQMFAKLKALLRKAAVRSVEKLWDTIGLLLNAFCPAECANYLRNSDYVQPREKFSDLSQNSKRYL